MFPLQTWQTLEINGCWICSRTRDVEDLQGGGSEGWNRCKESGSKERFYHSPITLLKILAGYGDPALLVYADTQK